MMQSSRRQRPLTFFSTLTLWQRVLFCFSALTLVFCLYLACAAPIHARHTPNRHDRRPDRESRIRYPRSRPTSTTNQGSSNTTLHSAPSTPDTAPPATDDEAPDAEQDSAANAD